jgi:hypothetical protein
VKHLATVALGTISTFAAPQITRSSGDMPVTVPFELSNGHMFVEAYVNGKGPYRFGFDTGASGVGRADSRLVRLLALPTVGEVANSDGIKTTSTTTVALASLRLGTLEKRNVQVPARDYNPDLKPGAVSIIMGIIARDFFTDRLVAIDYPSRTISFSRRSLRVGQPGVVAYSGSLVVPLCFASGCTDAKIDTGSSRGIVLPKKLVGKVMASQPIKIGEARRSNGLATLYEMTLREPAQVGGETSTGQKVLYADPSTDTAVIGSDFLKKYVLTIDQQNHLLRIELPRKR